MGSFFILQKIFIYMKSLIKKLLREGLDEAEYNYHVSSGGMPLGNNPEPYGSDNIFRMQGRGTGHFGSGVYFSTYKCGDNTDYDNKYGQYGSKSIPNNPELINVEANLYRVDFDIYKNLYRVNNNNHAEILFKTLKLCNETFYSFNAAYEDEQKVPNWLGNRYLLLKNNLEKLALKIPNYKEFIEMLIKSSTYYTDFRQKKNTNEDTTLEASFSTKIMEYNGYNGVNVSSIHGYDNTLHGSVIYDMSKIDGNPKPITNIGMFCKITNKGVAGEMLTGNKSEDLKLKLLNDKDLISTDFELINQLPQQTQLMIMKRYNKFIPDYNITYLNDYCKTIYFKTLAYKLKNGLIEEAPNVRAIESIIDNGYLNIIYDPTILFNGSTFLLYVLNVIWRFDEEVKTQIINNIPRELNPDEQEQLKMYHEEYG